MKKILLLNGPNLSLLGKREPEIYGTTTLQDIVDAVKEAAAKKGVDVVDIQSDEEGVLVKAICDAREWADGIIINPAAYTHTSVAIHDAIKGSGLKAIEVHISNVYAREGYRHESLTAGVCVGQICGLGVRGYLLALEALVG
jgi:3-dehydroquinate dehydratase-2